MRRQFIPWRDLVWAVGLLHLLTWLVLPALGVAA